MGPQETYSQLFEICPLTMRTQGVLLVRDAISTMALCSADGELSASSLTPADPRSFVAGAKPDQWKRRCDELVTRLDEYIGALLRNMQRFLEIRDGLGAEIIQSSCVCCLAHLAMLCDLVSRVDPDSKPRMDTICDSSLERLGHLTQAMNFDGYTYLDLLLRVRHEVDHS